MDDKYNEVIDYFGQLYKHEHLNEMKAEEDTVSGTIQPPKHTNSDHTEAIRQSSEITKDK